MSGWEDQRSPKQVQQNVHVQGLQPCRLQVLGISWEELCDPSSSLVRRVYCPRTPTKQYLDTTSVSEIMAI